MVLVLIPVPDEIWYRNKEVRLVLSVADDNAITYLACGKEGVQYCSWKDWVSWIVDDAGYAQLLGKLK
jgi:hypothetical protein